MVERKVTVVNPTGLHLRPAGLLCQTSMKFDSKVMIFYKEKEIRITKLSEEGFCFRTVQKIEKIDNIAH